MTTSTINPLTPTVASVTIMGTAKASCARPGQAVICNCWHSNRALYRRSAPSGRVPGCQKLQM